MTDTTLNQHNDAPSQRERYTIGYPEQRTRAFATRTATGEREGNAGFFSAHLNPGMSVVDCGCGPGSITTGFAEIVQPGQVLGIDVGESQIDFARRLAAERNVGNVRFEVGSIYKIPASDGSFDAAYSQLVLEFLKNPLDAVNEMYRVLKSEGIIGLVSTDWGSRIVWPIDPVVEEAWELSMRLWKHNGGDPQLGRRLPELLRSAGFKMVKAESGSSTSGRSKETGRVGVGMSGIYLEPQVVNQMIELGWVDDAKVEEMRAALNAWTEHPDAFRANMYITALGWKE